MKRHYVLPENVFSSDAGMPTYCVFYDASDVDARIAELEKSLEAGRATMRDLWRLDPEIPPSHELAQRCKAFMGGG